MRIMIGLLISWLAMNNAMALSSDRDQPADIEADDIEFNFKTGIRRYEGNVLAIQGTLQLKADKLIAYYNKDGDLDNAKVWGSLARFKQRPDGKQHDVEGWAKQILVNQRTNTLTLLGKASLKQGGNVARGETIIYNMANDTLQVKGAAKVGTAGKKAKPSKVASTAPKTTKPKPFADNPQSSTPTAGQTEIKTVPSGRSRLIIQPK